MRRSSSQVSSFARIKATASAPGTLVSAILNDPGPLSIGDREMEVRLGNCLVLLLQAEMMAATAGAARKRKR